MNMSTQATSQAVMHAREHSHWRVYLTIFRQLPVASWLFSGLLVLFMFALVATQVFAAMRLTTVVFGWSWNVLLFVGLGLGKATSDLWGSDSRRLVPDYHRRLMRVVTVTALAIWSTIPLTYWLGSVDRDGMSWVGGVWLWSYGLLGLSFIWGFFVTRKMHWLARVLMMSFALLPWWALVGYAPFREWLFSPLAPAWPGYTPINLLSLLLGPHNWPLFFARRMPAVQEAAHCSSLARIEQRVRTGTALDGFVMRELLQFFHAKSRLRPEFRVCPPALLGWLWGPLAMALFVGVFAKIGILYLAIVAPTLAPSMALLTAITPLSASIGRKSLGRYTLLPGAAHRRELPAWLTRRYFAVCAAVIAFLWLPSLLVAIWAEIPAAVIGRFVAALLLSLAGATALQIFVLPGKTTVLSTPTVFLTVFVGTIAAVNAALIVNDAGARLVFAGVAVSIATSTVLYLWGLRRWKTIDLGG
ncbi:MAG: hypothetical protein NT159_23930 [Proteobacteria bacterium]|nr:hypothetical protein [Pseudomonadota bacterium]